jgi:pimeloyl-ACP methyl ester carboxylesterase
MTTALTLGTLLLGLYGGYVCWALQQIAAGATPWPFALGLVALPFVLPVIGAALWFTLAFCFGTPVPADCRLGRRERIALFWNEVQAIRRSGPRMVLHRWLLRDPAPAPAAVPVLLLHGVLCNAGVWFGPRRHLLQRGVGPVYALSYGPPFASIDAFAQQVAAKIDEILRATGARQVALVGHSMGGLVARAYLRDHGAAKVRLLLTVGTPHHGSMHACLFPGACLAQLRPGNPWLTALNAAPLPDCRVVSLWSRHDSMVAPQENARLDGAVEVVIHGVGHNALLADPAVLAAVACELAAASAAS